jgi:hypothetical protein
MPTGRSAAPSDGSTRELVVFFGDSAERADGVRVLFWLFTMPPAMAALVAGLVGTGAGLDALLVASTVGVFVWLARRKVPPALVRVEDRGVVITSGPSPGRDDRFTLEGLANVTLDVKTIERAMDGGSAIPALRMNAGTAPPVDTARIVFVGADGREVLLSEKYVAHMDATEWLGKIRLFLRRHGWVPEDERGR